jgi:cyclase
VPLIASGGVGKVEDFSEVFQETNVDAGLAASVFHFRELTVDQVKAHLREQKVVVR